MLLNISSENVNENNYDNMAKNKNEILELLQLWSLKYKKKCSGASSRGYSKEKLF